MRPAQKVWPQGLNLCGCFRSRRASDSPYPTCCRQYALTEGRRWCQTTADGLKPIRSPRSSRRQQMSTSSAAFLKIGSNPPISSRARFRKAADDVDIRSEEHTSELQSLAYL